MDIFLPAISFLSAVVGSIAGANFIVRFGKVSTTLKVELAVEPKMFCSKCGSDLGCKIRDFVTAEKIEELK